MSSMTYRGYSARVEFDAEDRIFVGHLAGVRDIVGFLVYIGEPMQLDRQRLGFWVLGFLFVFGILSYLLKREIWKDVR